MNPVEIRDFLYSLGPEKYAQFVKELHFHCPFKTTEMTDEIVDHLKNDHSMKSEEFNQIIDERKAEHLHDARENRQGDLRRILDMKSKAGLDPLELFPKEIWLIIYDDLLPEDKRNLRGIHETFRSLTEDTVINDVLLPMILGVKVERFWGTSDNPHGDGDDAVYSPLAQYTQLRLVSKSVRNAVDRWFEDDILLQIRNGSKHAIPSGVVRADIVDHSDLQKFTEMKEHLESLSSPKLARFFTRSLEIVSPTRSLDPDLAYFPGIIDEMLDHIGSQIWFFSFQFCCPMWLWETSFADRYTTFLGWLSRMPNLKWLKLSVNQRESATFGNFMIQEGLLSPPSLTHLERMDLELKERNRVVLPVFSQLLNAYSAHVKILNLIGLKSVLLHKNGFVASDSECARIPLALEVLSIDGPTSTRPGEMPGYSYPDNSESDNDDDDDDDFDDSILLESIKISNWPLKCIDWELEMVPFFADSIFTALGNLQTLEKLRLSVKNLIIRNDNVYLKLPNLNHFEMKIKKSHCDSSDGHWSFFFTLQFLLHAKKLKTLIWKCDMGEKCWEKVRDDAMNIYRLGLGEMIDFCWFFCDLLGLSAMMCDVALYNIWSVFPSLEKVMLELVVRDDDDDGWTVNKSVSEKYLRRELDFTGVGNSDSLSSSSSSSAED